jgi:alkylation response protein AidB-like acyl-CoA dehydrogenase
MNFQLSTEQQLLQDSLRRFVDKAWHFEARRAWLANTCDGAQQHWQTLAANGWLAATLPEAYGGLGGSLAEAILIAEEFGRGLVLEPYFGHAVLAAQAILAAGTPTQKEALLPPLAEGSRCFALAYSEPSSRGMPSPVTTRAVAEGARFELHGHKTLVLAGARTDSFIVSAAVGKDVGLFLVDAGSRGLRRIAVPLHDGTRAEELVLDGVAVDAQAMLGVPAHGSGALQTALQHGILALGADLIGCMQRAIELTTEYVKTRQQFDVTISSFQVIRHRLADMTVELETARSMLFAALASMEQDDAPTRAWTLAAAKALICRAARAVCGQAIQLHGGIGLTEECAIGHYFKRAVVAEQLLGSSDIHDAANAQAGVEALMREELTT